MIKLYIYKHNRMFYKSDIKTKIELAVCLKGVIKKRKKKKKLIP